MIYTIGYQFLSPERLQEIASSLNAIVIDVRSSPSGRVKRGFSRSDLQYLLGSQYKWWGVIYLVGEQRFKSLVLNSLTNLIMFLRIASLCAKNMIRLIAIGIMTFVRHILEKLFISLRMIFILYYR